MDVCLPILLAKWFLAIGNGKQRWQEQEVGTQLRGDMGIENQSDEDEVFCGCWL